MLGDYPTEDVACPQKIPPHGRLLVCQTAGQFLYDGDGVLFERNPSPECGFGFDIIASADEILLFNIPEDARSSTLNTSHVLDRTGPWGCLEDAPGLTKYRRVRKRYPFGSSAGSNPVPDSFEYVCSDIFSDGRGGLSDLGDGRLLARNVLTGAFEIIAWHEDATPGRVPSESVCTTGALARNMSDGTSWNSFQQCEAVAPPEEVYT